VFSGAYKVNILRILYRSVDTHCILFRVEFEDGSSVSVLRNRATCYKKFTAGNRRFLKRSNACPLTFFSYPAFSKPMSHPPWQAQNTMITAAGSKMRHCVWGNYGGSRISANEKIKDGRSWKYRNLQVSYFFFVGPAFVSLPFITHCHIFTLDVIFSPCHSYVYLVRSLLISKKLSNNHTIGNKLARKLSSQLQVVSFKSYLYTNAYLLWTHLPLFFCERQLVLGLLHGKPGVSRGDG
jgi:hypothetical protein